MQTKKLFRSNQDKIFGGVAGGLSVYFELDSVLIRVIFIVLTLAGGSGILLYLLLWLLLPSQSDASMAVTQATIEKNAKDIEEQAKKIVKNLQLKSQKLEKNFDKPSQPTSPRANWLGLGLIIVGSLLLLQQLGVIHNGLFWPLFLIILGVIIAIK